MDDDSLVSALNSLKLAPSRPVGSALNPVAVLVDTSDLLLECLNDLKHAKSIAVDLKGVNLSRAGRLSLLQMYRNGSSSCWIIDVTVLEHEAFEAPKGTTSSIKSILGDIAVRKIFYDCRNDADALLFHYKVTLSGVYDLQLHELAMREFDNAGSFRPRHLGFIHGLKKAIEQNLPHSSSVVQLKAKGLRLFAPELGGRYEVFEERPLAPEILSYSAQDVVILFKLKDAMRVPANTEARVLKESIKRVNEVKLSSYNPHGRQKALAPSRHW